MVRTENPTTSVRSRSDPASAGNKIVSPRSPRMGKLKFIAFPEPRGGGRKLGLLLLPGTLNQPSGRKPIWVGTVGNGGVWPAGGFHIPKESARLVLLDRSCIVLKCMTQPKLPPGPARSCGYQ